MLVGLVSTGSAQDSIRLAEVLPALEGSELGQIEVAPAPEAGKSRVVTRAEVLAALQRAGRSAQGLSIPRRKVVRRTETPQAKDDELRTVVTPALNEALRPCAVSDVTLPAGVVLPPGQREISAQAGPVGNRSRMNAYVFVRAPGREVRVPVMVSVDCPQVVVQSGRQVRIVAAIGNVRASASGEARQNGRVGEIIRVYNQVTRKMLRAKVIDEQTVEVVP